MVKLSPKSQEVQRVIQFLYANYPEMESDEEFKALTLESETNLVEILSRLVSRLIDEEAMIEGIESKIKELLQRKIAAHARHDTMREEISALMQCAGVKSVKTHLATLSIKGGARKLFGDADPYRLPEHLVKISVDRMAVKQALESGEHVEGFVLSNGEPILSVRKT